MLGLVAGVEDRNEELEMNQLGRKQLLHVVTNEVEVTCISDDSAIVEDTMVMVEDATVDDNSASSADELMTDSD